MITHFAITPQCIDCDNPEDIVITITVTNDTEEAAEDVLLEVTSVPSGVLVAALVALGYGSATHGTWSIGFGQVSAWSIPLLGSQETATTTITLPPGAEDADFCGPTSPYLPLTFDATLPAYPATPPVPATLQLCDDTCTPTLQPPGSGRNTPIARVSERNGLTVFFPGEADRTCIQGTCPMPVCSDPAPGPGCVEVILQGAANNNQEPFDAPGFEWGVTPSFILIPPGGAQEGIIFEWIVGEGRYFSGTGAECGDGEPEEGWTFTLGEPGSPSGCAIVLAGCS